MKAFLAALGFFIILGTAGASDQNSISLMQVLIQSIIGLALMCIGTMDRRKEHRYD